MPRDTKFKRNHVWGTGIDRCLIRVPRDDKWRKARNKRKAERIK